jgi:protein phosphatase
VAAVAIEAYGLTDPGRKRKGNEDSLAIEPELGLVIVADGMGGHQSGEVASQLAVETIREFVGRAQRDRDLTWPFGLDPARSFAANCLATAIKLANQTVYRAAAARPEQAGMGTTVVAVMAYEGRVIFASVGDSRVYLWRGKSLRQLTRDDSWREVLVSQQLIDATEAESHQFRHVLTKAVGLQEDVDFPVGEVTPQDGDGFLLCSDGLTTAVSDGRIQEIVAGQGPALERACRALVEAANEAGGPDNVTVAFLRVRAR